MVNVSYNNIGESVTSGIKKATKEHIKLTNQYNELSWGPEYFLTVNIVNELKRLSAAYIYLEEAMSESQEAPKGKAPEEWGPKKRYDIVVRKSDGSPYAAIEVKHRVYRVSDRVVEDFKRISYAVNSKEDGDSIFKMGIFAFYTVFYGDKSDPVKQKKSINDLYTKLEEELKEYKGRATLDKRLIEPTPYSHDRSIVWGGGCFVLSPP
jgi:hypothetical protein